MTLYFNSTEQPFVFNDDGMSVGGWEWFESEPTDQIKSGIERSEIVRINRNTANAENVEVSVSAEDAKKSRSSE